MAKPFSLTHHLSLLLLHTRSHRLFIPTTTVLPFPLHHHHPFSLSPFHKPLSTNPTPYPLQYELIINRPVQKHPPRVRRHAPQALPEPHEPDEPEEQEPTSEFRLDSWVDRKLSFDSDSGPPSSSNLELDKAKRKYYNKRRKRMYGSDSEEEEARSRNEEKFVELKPEVVEFPTLHRREEELYFYDAFAYPWEKEKHYKMVYQLEKKYFPDQCLDKAFLKPGQSNANVNANLNENENENVDGGVRSKGKGRKRAGVSGGGGVRGEKKDDMGDDKLVFFDEKREDERKGDGGLVKDLKEKKVEEFFKGLKRVDKKDGEVSSVNAEPFLSSRRTGLPPVWDSPHGTVVLINKPKGWTSFTVCGKLRRIVKVKKVGHAGTLDPMATGLLIVCVGKATKLVDRYQGMIKGYSGVFRLGEATSTWDADSPVIQREPWEHIKDEDIKRNAASFCGEIWQVPPMFSAIKVGGERMYDKARRGENVELSPRRISIFQFDIERSLDDRKNLIFRVTCSKGTYIRSLCADFGKAVGSCAHLTALRRDSIGQYSADDAWDFQELEEAITKSYL
ncbi:hypothetical protein PIB30_041451 [Stylosanthes scabra]|uniref:tRNA pseudouridine(55) synthase n=1 Tax=Stylosanthes scabra TaxID=79078 RepID=A0ABU6YF83_9FABA|nr:hypothetical protein [Stylosanthes scabra]